MDQELATDEKLICSNCGKDTFWAFKSPDTGEQKLYCVYCHEKLT